MSEERTVWVVERGYYSGRGVECVFSTEEAAKQFCEVRNGHGGYDHDEFHYDWFPLDPLDRIATGRIWHRVDFDYEGGLEEIKTLGDDDYTDVVPDPNVVETARTKSGKQWLRVWVEARDPEQAVKIAAEKRAEYLAAQAGIS